MASHVCNASRCGELRNVRLTTVVILLPSLKAHLRCLSYRTAQVLYGKLVRIDSHLRVGREGVGYDLANGPTIQSDALASARVELVSRGKLANPRKCLCQAIQAVHQDLLAGILAGQWHLHHHVATR